ncbi:hypothetical protein BLNAU_19708 [Blattamonas nauphoetae]|uniref:GYF domain-containing protein n=1 Tax=Blattamonas nauphoetae TaxID=2049346 RepID=A0ABQ9X1B1_9EUKA|nr:hypothetical protein BLNAU_19708 [Blattamonas nauphoetae]
MSIPQSLSQDQSVAASSVEVQPKSTIDSEQVDISSDSERESTPPPQQIRYTFDEFLSFYSSSAKIIPGLQRKIAELHITRPIIKSAPQPAILLSGHLNKRNLDISEYYQNLNQQKLRTDPLPSIVTIPQVNLMSSGADDRPRTNTHENGHTRLTLSTTTASQQSISFSNQSDGSGLLPDASAQSKRGRGQFTYPGQGTIPPAVTDQLHKQEKQPQVKTKPKQSVPIPQADFPRIQPQLLNGKTWHVVDQQGGIQGPFSTDEMKRMFDSGALKPTQYVHLNTENSYFTIATRFPPPLRPFQDLPILTADYAKKYNSPDLLRITGLSKEHLQQQFKQSQQDLAPKVKLSHPQRAQDEVRTLSDPKKLANLPQIRLADGSQQSIDPSNQTPLQLRPTQEKKQQVTKLDKNLDHNFDAVRQNAIQYESSKQVQRQPQVVPEANVHKHAQFQGRIENIQGNPTLVLQYEGQQLMIPEEAIVKWQEYYYTEKLSSITPEQRSRIPQETIDNLKKETRNEAIQYLLPYAQQQVQQQKLQQLQQQQLNQPKQLPKQIPVAATAQPVKMEEPKEAAKVDGESEPQKSRLKPTAKPFQPRFQPPPQQLPQSSLSTSTTAIGLEAQEQSLGAVVVSDLSVEQYQKQVVGWLEDQVAKIDGKPRPDLVTKLLSAQTPQELDKVAREGLGDNDLTTMFILHAVRYRMDPF